MNYIDNHIVEQITDAADKALLEIIEEYVGQLKQKGGNYWGLSPFKQEETPSFSVNPAKFIFKCFATGIGGNVVKFLMEVNRWNWLETMHHLAERFQIETKGEQTETERANAERISALRALCDWATTFFHNNLMENGSHVWEYLEGRGYDLEDCKKYKLGLALSSWDALTVAALKQGFTQTHLVDAGLVGISKSNKPYERFRDRIIFPIRDDYGRTIAFSGRIYKASKDQPKYINSPATALYNKAEVLYNLSNAREAIIKEDKAIILEGYTDVLALDLVSVSCVVATCGTALSSSQVAKLKRLTRNIIIVRDGDEAGKKATLRDIDLCLEGDADPTVLSLPDNLDPDSFLAKFGADKFRELLENPTEWHEYKVAAFEGDLAIPRIKSRLVEDLAKSVKLIANPILKTETAKAICTRLDLSEKALDEAIAEQPFRLSSRLTWDNYRRLCTRLDLRINEDFEAAESGGVLINYKDINDNRIKKTSQGIDYYLSRDTMDGGENPYGVYIPPLLRIDAKEMAIESRGRLVVVHDEITASILADLGIPAVGISRPDGFQGGPGSTKPARLLKQLFNKGFNRVVYLLSGEAFHLPKVKRIVGKPPYQDIDAGHISRKYVKSLLKLITVFSQNRVWVITPGIKENLTALRWVEKMLLDKVDISSKIWESVDFVEESEDNTIKAFEVTNYTEKNFKELVKIDDAQKFFDFHGHGQLGELFRLDRTAYKVDLDGRVETSGAAIDPEVFKKDGVYYARGKGGIKDITNFSMDCNLRIMGRGAFGIYTLNNPSSKQVRQVIIKNEDFGSGDKFRLRISEIPRLNGFAKASSTQLAELFQLVCESAPEAVNLRSTMGWYVADDEIDEQEAEERRAFWVFGNGILNGRWRPADQKGLVHLDGETYFLPALSSIKEDSTRHAKKYERQIEFVYKESNFSFNEWVVEVHAVHGLNGHKAICFAMMAMYFDLILKKMGKAPLMHFMGPPGTGKDELRESIASLWGSIKWMDLQTSKITTAGYAAFFQQYRNALNIVNEVNPSSVDSARIDPLKSVYEGKLGEKKVGPNSNEMDSGSVTSATLILGQEPINHMKAIAHRTVPCLFEERTYTPEQTTRFNRLKSRQKLGLGQIFKKLAIHHDLVNEKFEDKYEVVMKRIKSGIEAPTGNTERLAQNWAIMLTTLWIFIEEGIVTNYPLSFEFMINNAIEEIERQDSQMVKQGLLEIFFFDFIQVHYMQTTKYRLHHQHIFLQKETLSYEIEPGKSVPTPEGVVTIQVNNIHSLFSSFLRDSGKKLENTSKSDLRRLLKKHPAFLTTAVVEWIGYKMDQNGQIIETGRGPVKARSSAYVFDAAILKLDIDYTFTFDIDYDEPPLEKVGAKR